MTLEKKYAIAAWVGIFVSFALMAYVVALAYGVL